MKVFEFLLFCLLIATKEARIFEKCELLRYLKEFNLDGFRGFRLNHWICLALYSSEFDTEHYEFDGTTPYYGIFQLNGLIWCSNGRHHSENRCHTECDNFLDDEIEDDIMCAKKVIAETKEEMLSWPRYAEFCTESMPEITSWECS